MLIDGHSLAYRAYFAMQDTPLSITREDGQKELTNAVYGFANMLVKVWNEERPDYLAVASTSAARSATTCSPTTRPLAPRCRTSCRPDRRIVELVEAFDIPAVSAEGFEADDVLGTLARRGSERGHRCAHRHRRQRRLPADRPASQVLTPGRCGADHRPRRDQIRRRYGLSAGAAHRLQGPRRRHQRQRARRQGHRRENRRRCSCSTARSTAIYEHLDEIAQKRARTALESGRDSAYLSKQLVAIRTDVPLEVDGRRAAHRSTTRAR